MTRLLIISFCLVSFLFIQSVSACPHCPGKNKSKKSTSESAIFN